MILNEDFFASIQLKRDQETLWCWMPSVFTFRTLAHIWGVLSVLLALKEPRDLLLACADSKTYSGKARILGFWNWEEPQESFMGTGLSLLRKSWADLPLHIIRSEQSQFLLRAASPIPALHQECAFTPDALEIKVKTAEQFRCKEL